MTEPTSERAASPMPEPVGGARWRSANDAAFLREAPSKGEWPATTILAHLRACADVWGSCIAAVLAVLERLPPETWSRTAVVTGAGSVLERTLNWYALGLAAHERSHVKQILRIVKSASRRVRPGAPEPPTP